MYKPANLKKNLGVGAWAPIVIHPTGDGAAIRNFLRAGGKTLTLGGVKFSQEELESMCADIPPAPEPSEREREAEYAAHCAVTEEA